MTTEARTEPKHVVAYRRTDGAILYYRGGPFAGWTTSPRFDPPTYYPSAEEAERAAQTLAAQRKRSGTVYAATI